MSDELVFYTNPMSRGRLVRWMLEEVGQPYRTEILEYGTTMKAPAYLAINPLGKVPALRHGDVVVTECAAICAYLADAFPTARLAPPPGDRLRGPYYRWLFFAAGPLEQAEVGKELGFEVPPDKRSTVGFGTLADMAATVEAALTGREYLVGNRFSAADLYLGMCLNWGMMSGSMEKRPTFERYVARLRARPAAARAKAIDDALLPKKAG
ncbi:MAG: glutathione S-transferase family protein [Hyphomicrobiaceae bacterium]